jgi:glycine betaine/choline ABC-type transport system substrate-binding protein
LAATAEFIAPGGPLEQLKAVYGEFSFKAVTTCDPGTQYYLLNRGDADVTNGITTAAAVTEDQLVVLADDKRVWPQYHFVTVVRMRAMSSHAELPVALDRVSRSLTAYALQQMSMREDLMHLDPFDVAEDFLRLHARM